MPTYEYMYERMDGATVKVERVNVPISQSSEDIVVVDTVDGISYIAQRIMSLTGDMSQAWTDDIRNSDLPPKHYGPADVTRDRAKRKGRKRSKATSSR